MSRPPRPLFSSRVAGDGSAFEADREFMPVTFTEMVDLQRVLAETEARLGVSGPSGDQEQEDGDFARTLMELSALVAHTLGLYQNLYSREAYLGTAETPRSLVFHGRRLAYEPDPGLAASGYLALTVGAGLQGRVPAGFAVVSPPRGEVKSQTFETLEELEVDAARNEAFPLDRTRPASLVFTGTRGTFRLAGAGLPLSAGSPGILVRDSDLTWEPVAIRSAAGDPEAATTTVEIDLLDSTSALADSTQPLAAPDGSPQFRLLAMPAAALRRFGWEADPVRFPTDQLKSAGAYPGDPSTSVANPDFGYEVTLESGLGLRAEDLFLSVALATDLQAQLVTARTDTGVQVLQVVEQGNATVAFRRGETISYDVGIIDSSGNPATESRTELLETQITGTVSYLRLEPATGSPLVRSTFAMPSPIHGDWQFAAEILATEPNPAPVSAPLEVDADFGHFRPGGLVAFQTLDSSFSQVMEVQSLTVTPEGTTELSWVPLTDPPAGEWTLDNLRVLGNVARVSHGESTEEVLGGSDGVTPFQRYSLKKAPLTQVPGAPGGEPAIEVRVNEVAWTRVADFFESTPLDRHYRVEVDEEQTTWVIFGSGRKGAIPPFGKKNIRAFYRQGLGADANVDSGAAGRIKKAHPLVERATNPTSIVGGAEPADPADLRSQATRYLRTFDRAVSIQDHADLALLFPGVARASARPTSAGGLEVVVATADGGLPPLLEVEAFLNARRDTSLPMTVVGPQAVDLYLDLTVEHAPEFLTENIRRAVQDALLEPELDPPGMFTFPARTFGQAAHLSEVYSRIAAVEGVIFLDVTRFRLQAGTGVKDVLQVNARQWLRLPPANLALSVAPGVIE